jgi:Bacterial capsule synthesis protein PGA_cap
VPTTGLGRRCLAALTLLCCVLAGCSSRGNHARTAVGATGTASATPASGGQTQSQPTGGGERDSFTIAATGDLLAHEPVVRAASAAAGGSGYDFRPLLAAIRPQLSAADLAICHLETPLSGNGRITYYPDFAAPRQIAPALAWAGFDTCTTASNHTLDQGVRGVRTTLDALDAAGVKHAGAARSAAEQRPASYLVRGVRVAHLDYTYGLNGRSLPAAAPWTVRLIDAGRILADARAARRGGAQFVVVGLHWGQEYSSTATASQRELARRLLASPDVDLILGCHTHVVQPIERISGKFVVYGMGNLLAHHAPCCNTPPTRDGLLIIATVNRRAGRYVVTRLTYTPTYVDQQTSRVLPVTATLRVPDLPAARRLELQSSWRRTLARVDQLGAARAGVVPTDRP